MCCAAGRYADCGRCAPCISIMACRRRRAHSATRASVFATTCTFRCTIISVSVHVPAGASIEAAARDARYAALAANLAPNECLLTAHHRKDQAETLLLQALRGAGVEGHGGHAGVPRLRCGMACAARAGRRRRANCCEFGARFAHLESIDPMNADVRFDRSYLRRHHLAVDRRALAGRGRCPVAHGASHGGSAVAARRRRRGRSGRLRDGEALSVPGLRALPPLRRINAVRLWLREAPGEAPSTRAFAGGPAAVFSMRRRITCRRSSGAVPPCDAIDRDCSSPRQIRRGCKNRCLGLCGAVLQSI